MGHRTLAFVGRAEELEELRAGVAGALAGRGGVWLLCGEPGIGKSRLAEELASDLDAPVIWGRCWEAGGAPAYWPWIQILRALLRRPEARQLLDPGRAAELFQLLPELADGNPDEPTPLSAEQARFRLMDAVGRLLCDAAALTPHVIVLDDLHAADPSSLLLLDFLGRQIRSAPVAVLGTFRDRGAQASPHLARIAQEARTIALRRLTRAEVGAFLERALPAPPPARLIEQVHARTEGNPLFVVELSRLMTTRAAGHDSASARMIPASLRSAIEARLAPLSPVARTALEQAAVIGREVEADAITGAFEIEPASLARALEEAAAADLLVPITHGRYRFGHILIREVVRDGIAEDRLHRLHFQVAEWLRRQVVHDTDRSWSEIAHHYFAAGDAGLEAAVEAAERAAQRALEQLAFDDAEDSYRRAIAAIDRAPRPAPVRRAELLLGLGHAQVRGGRLEAGRETCRVAAGLARSLDDADLLARAALELGGVLHFGHVQAELVDLLSEALDRLEATDSTLRARVMARLAAALQPAIDPRPPIALAHDAIAMARRIGDEDALLAALRDGTSSMVDLVPASARIELNREHVALATRRGDRVDALRGHARLAFDCFELGDLTGARAQLGTLRALADQLGHPTYRWRARSVDALLALWDGRLDDAEAALAEAHALADSGGDPNAGATLAFQRLHLLRQRGDSAGLVALAPALDQIFGPTPAGLALARVVACSALLAAGRSEEALARLPRDLVEQVLTIGDRTSFEPLAELAEAGRDRDLARMVEARMGDPDGQFLSGGVMGMVWYGPAERAAALIARTLDQHDRAEQLMRRAALRAREVGAGVLASRLERELSPAASAPASPAGPRLSMQREGDMWCIRGGAVPFRVKDVKGLHILARLVEQPGRELHALELATTAPPGAAPDAGDAGELIDEQAREQYRRRIGELNETIAEAEDRHDLATAERARTELELLTRELSRAFGLGGRSRRAGAAAERARVNVQRRLRDAVRRIGEHDPALGRHLERSLRTGAFCSYSPE